jgi:hypothetical protein
MRFCKSRLKPHGFTECGDGFLASSFDGQNISGAGTMSGDKR